MLFALLAACVLLSGTAGAAGNEVNAAALFSRPVLMRGSLGEAQVQMHVRPKAVAGEGMEGEYFVFGRSQKILVAGDIEAEEMFFEESENGTDVSGQWEGKREGEAIRGSWLSADGSISKPFLLTVVHPEAVSARPQQPSRKQPGNRVQQPRQ
ncbi:MAG: hypothetical protein V4632_20705 [Pseudomonadota bacterium]